jgi:hypothetical protein
MWGYLYGNASLISEQANETWGRQSSFINGRRAGVQAGFFEARQNEVLVYEGTLHPVSFRAG